MRFIPEMANRAFPVRNSQAYGVPQSGQLDDESNGAEGRLRVSGCRGQLQAGERTKTKRPCLCQCPDDRRTKEEGGPFRPSLYTSAQAKRSRRCGLIPGPPPSGHAPSGCLPTGRVLSRYPTPQTVSIASARLPSFRRRRRTALSTDRSPTTYVSPQTASSR